MIDNNRIQEEFASLIGFRRGVDVEDANIDADLTTSTSETYVDGLHPLLTSRNLEATMQENESYSATRPYETTTSYSKWEAVFKNGQMYYSKVDNNIGNDPSTSTTKWATTTFFSHYLRIKRNASIANLMNAVRTNAKLIGSKEVLQNTLLYYGSGKYFETKNNRFVGFMLTIQKQDLTVKVPRIILEFTHAQTIPLYVYHSSQDEAVATYSLDYTAAGRQQTFLLPTELLLRFENNNVGGFYTIGYYESDLTSDNRAIYTQDLPFSGRGCTTCNNRSATAYALYSPYMDIQSVQIDADFITEKPLQTWSDNDIVIVGSHSFGINLSFSVVCELTNAYIYNKDLFINALCVQMKLDFLTIIAHNSRNMQLSDKIRSQAFAELKSEQNPYNELKEAILALSLDMSNLNPVCIPCVDKKGTFKWGSVWR